MTTSANFTWRYLTADLRALPDFIVLGTQRGGSTSLYTWLSSHPQVAPAMKKEIHFFDVHYDKGKRWYRAHFPIARSGRITGEASPYMLFHPLSPERAARDLSSTTRFIALLRNPVERAISHYWFTRRMRRWEETEPLERAIELEPQRLAAEKDRILRGGRSFRYASFSYMARGEYAGQLRAWFDAVGRERILVVESEQLYTDPLVPARVVEWLGLAPHGQPFPVSNRSQRLGDVSTEVVARLQRHFEPHNRELFELLGYELWTD